MRPVLDTDVQQVLQSYEDRINRLEQASLAPAPFIARKSFAGESNQYTSLLNSELIYVDAAKQKPLYWVYTAEVQCLIKAHLHVGIINASATPNASDYGYAHVHLKQTGGSSLDSYQAIFSKGSMPYHSLRIDASFVVSPGTYDIYANWSVVLGSGWTYHQEHSLLRFDIEVYGLRA